MKRMFLLFSHKLTASQEADAKDSLGVGEFVYLDEKLQELWSNIPPDLGNIKEYLDPIIEFLKSSLKSGDVVLVQGDFGATCYMVRVIKELGGVAVYATTKRDTAEIRVGDKVEKKSVFKHVMFREYL